MNVVNDELDLNVLRHAIDYHAAELPNELAEQLLHGIQSIQRQEPQAVEHLVAQFRQNLQLDDIYERSLNALRQDYSAQERAKSLVLSAHQSTAQNLPQECQQIFNDVIAIIQRSLSDRKQRELDRAQMQILKALVHYKLTTEDLAYTIGRSTSETQAIVQSLWKKGYIDALNAPLTFTIFPKLRNHRYRQKLVEPNVFLTLTSTGYFHLYPVFKVLV